MTIWPDVESQWYGAESRRRAYKEYVGSRSRRRAYKGYVGGRSADNSPIDTCLTLSRDSSDENVYRHLPREMSKADVEMTCKEIKMFSYSKKLHKLNSAISHKRSKNMWLQTNR